ncbi:hypothetical protein ANN_10412 [Periplaneta americana]|uniref:Reverse transcriptase n=1 Tax=Periplaneta americana TaxID=6978 RepID=A0ABQ8TR78_PERAM|nr:hypothetical protein ANN_10412 [Periplaneta americana]
MAGLCEGGNDPPARPKKFSLIFSSAHLWSNGQRVWPRNQVGRVRIQVWASYLVEFFPGFSLSPIRVNAGTFSTTRCRHPGCSETETLGHVLGFCKKGELLRNNRHHRARTAIANLLRNRGWEVHEEIHCVSEDDSHRRVDIIAINRRTQKAMVLDPTICFERDTNQALQINDDKRAKYVPCLPYLSEKYGTSLYNWDVTGLLFGARGCLPKFTCDILKSFQIPFYEVQKIVMEILEASLQILHYHLYVNT